MKKETKKQLTFKGRVKGKYAISYIGKGVYMYIPAKYVIIKDNTIFAVNKNVYNNIQSELIFKQF